MTREMQRLVEQASAKSLKRKSSVQRHTEDEDEEYNTSKVNTPSVRLFANLEQENYQKKKKLHSRELMPQERHAGLRSTI